MILTDLSYRLCTGATLPPNTEYDQHEYSTNSEYLSPRGVCCRNWIVGTMLLMAIMTGSVRYFVGPLTWTQMSFVIVGSLILTIVVIRFFIWLCEPAIPRQDDSYN